METTTPRATLLTAADDLARAGRIAREADDQEMVIDAIELAEKALVGLRAL